MWQALLPNILSAAFVASLTWIFSKAKSRAEIAKMKEETAAVYLQNVEDAVALWKGIAKDLETQVVNLTTEVKMLRRENAELRSEVTKLEKTINKKI